MGSIQDWFKKKFVASGEKPQFKTQFQSGANQEQAGLNEPDLLKRTASTDDYSSTRVTVQPMKSSATKREARPVGWYELSESKQAYQHFSKSYASDHYIFLNPEKVMVKWDGSAWKDWDDSPGQLMKTALTLDMGRGYSGSMIPSDLLNFVEFDDRDQFRVLDYLAKFPIQYSNLYSSRVFDEDHLNRWKRFFTDDSLPRPDYRFAKLYLSPEEDWGAPGDLELEATSFVLPSPLLSGVGHKKYVKAVIGVEFVEGYLDEVPDSIKYKVLAWADEESARLNRYPIYDALTPPESMVLSELLGYVLDFPLPPGELRSHDQRELHRLLQVIHRPEPSEVGMARDESLRSRCLKMLEAAYGRFRIPNFTLFHESRLSVYGPEAIELAYGRMRACLPPRRLVKTYEDAEYYVAEVMKSLGFSSVFVSPPGSDEGIDVSTAEALVQVKMEGVKTSREKIQRLTGVCAFYGKRPIFFSLAGYSKPALEWAEKTSTACFEFGLDGDIAARTLSAETLLGSS